MCIIKTYNPNLDKNPQIEEIVNQSNSLEADSSNPEYARGVKTSTADKYKEWKCTTHPSTFSVWFILCTDIILTMIIYIFITSMFWS